MTQQPERGAISRPRVARLVAGTRRGLIRPLFASRSARNGTPAPVAGSRTPDSALVLARYRAEQDALGRQAVNVIRNIWDQQIDPEPFSASWPKVYPLLRQVTLLHYRASAASAAKFYRAVCYFEDQGLPAMRIATPNVPKLDHIADSVANGTFYRQLNKYKIPAPDASMAARNMMSGAAARFALMGGRDTVIGTALNDPKAQGWERLTEASACGYCVMQATRGPFSAGMTDFHPHDYCSCVAAPLFKGRQPANADLKAEWKQVTQGMTGKAARAAWEVRHGQDTTGGNNSGTQETGVTGQGTTQ